MKKSNSFVNNLTERNDIMPNIFPMLAHTKPAEPLHFHHDQYWMQEKLDGERRLLHVREHDILLTGRKLLKSGLLSEVSDKTPYLNQAGLRLFHGTILDGELMHPKGFKHLSRVMRSNTEKALTLQNEQGHLVYHLYDILSFQGVSVESLPYHQRYDLLTHFFSCLPPSCLPFFRLVKSHKKQEDKEAFYNEVLSDVEKEGVMFRDKDAPYEVGKRSRSLLRMKKEFTEDVILTHILPPEYLYTGNHVDTWTYWHHPDTDERREGFCPGQDWNPVTYAFFHDLPTTFTFAQFDKDENLVPLGTCSGFSREIAMSMKMNPHEWLNSVVELKANQRFDDTNALRHPRFHRARFDKYPMDCVIPHND